MDLLHNLGIGFAAALSVANLLGLLFGAVLGTLIGVLPGIGPVTAIALLLPAVLRLDATTALIMLAAIYAGAQYGAASVAILHKGAGEAPRAGVDARQMARQGRAGAALAASTIGAFIAGSVGALVIAALALPLAELAFRFGPAEYFSLMVLGLVGAAALASGSFLKSVAMTLFGLLLAQVNTEPVSHTPRFDFDLPQLEGGIGLVVLAVGVFGAGEVIGRIGRVAERREAFATGLRGTRPTLLDAREAWPSILRGTALGAALGLLPGAGALLASFAAYAIEKRLVRNPRIPFGKGAIQGVAGPEAANNAAAQTSFLPMLAFGIPTNAVMALVIGAMLIKGIQPGPQVMTSQPQLFWGLVASMWIGNLALLAINLPLAGLCSRLLGLPYRRIYPVLLLLGCLGVYALGERSFDLYLMAFFACCGYLFLRLGCDPAPLLLGFVLEPMMEENLRHALLSSGGDWKTLVTRPLSSGLLIAALLLVVVVALPAIKQKREIAFQED
jgi:putative tricarboxylic transport membrane protein